MQSPNLIIENGQGVIGANTIQDNSCIDNYAKSRMGCDGWLKAKPDEKTKANITAAEMMGEVKWRGTKSYAPRQIFFLPRRDLIDSDGSCIPYNFISSEFFLAHARASIALILGTLAPPGFNAQVKSVSGEGSSIKFVQPVVMTGDDCTTQPATTDIRNVMGREVRIFFPSKIQSLHMIRG